MEEESERTIKPLTREERKRFSEWISYSLNRKVDVTKLDKLLVNLEKFGVSKEQEIQNLKTNIMLLENDILEKEEEIEKLKKGNERLKNAYNQLLNSSEHKARESDSKSYKEFLKKLETKTDDAIYTDYHRTKADLNDYMDKYAKLKVEYDKLYEEYHKVLSSAITVDRYNDILTERDNEIKQKDDHINNSKILADMVFRAYVYMDEYRSHLQEYNDYFDKGIIQRYMNSLQYSYQNNMMILNLVHELFSYIDYLRNTIQMFCDTLKLNSSTYVNKLDNEDEKRSLHLLERVTAPSFELMEYSHPEPTQQEIDIVNNYTTYKKRPVVNLQSNRKGTQTDVGYIPSI